MPKVGHTVTRPGLRPGNEPITIPVAEELETVPGIPVNDRDVDFYSREHPLESQSVEYTADREWVWTVFTPEEHEYRKQHEQNMEPLQEAARASGDMPPTGTPEPGRDVTEEIRAKAREMGFGEVGFTKYDRRYVFQSKKDWVKYEHAICLALEQDYEATQSLPSLEAEYTHFGTYEVEQQTALVLGDYIRSLGYHAQIHSPLDNSAPYIPMFVQAGLGQLGANGQLLSPHFGSRARLLIVTTDAPVTYDQPVDYGIHRFCQICQVCVNRCPGRAITRDKVWYRGVEKNKVIYKRCRPVMARYEGCGVCMKACPIQRYGMKPVMEHYIATGQVLGKGTDGLEGYSLRDKGYFGPGELPHFDPEFFQIPRGRSEDWLFEQFKEKLEAEEIPDGPDGDQVLRGFRDQVKKYLKAGSSTTGSE